MSALFRSVNLNTQQQLVREMNSKGYACLSGYLSDEQLAVLRQQTRIDALRHRGQYFAHHGGEAIATSLLGAMGAAPEFQSLLISVYQLGAGKPAYSNVIHPVLRCVQGTSGRKESNCFHYDASYLTALVPVEIPTEGRERGDLMLFPNLRAIRGNVLTNVLEKALLQNRLCRRLITSGIRMHLLAPLKLQLVPGNLYLFWGYRSLHANEPCDPANCRATAIFHYGDPHAGSLLTRLILKLNQRRARRASEAAGVQPAR